MQQIEQNAIPSPFMLFDTLSEGVCIVDRQWCYLYANKKAAEILGRPREELLGKNIWELFPEATETLSSAQAHRAVKEHNPTHFDVYSPLLEKWFECRFYPCSEGLVMLLQDMSERKRQEEHTQFQTTILANIQESVIVTDLQGTITYWNKGAEYLFGYTASDMLGKTFALLYPTVDMYALQANMQQVLAGKANVGERECRRKDGTVVWIDRRTTLLRTAEGQPMGFLNISKDVTQRRQADALVRRQAALLELTTEAIIVWKFQGPILYWNRGATLLYGFTKEEAVGRITHDLFQTQPSEPLERIYETLLQTGIWEGELSHITKDGRNLVVESIMALVTEDDGSQSILEINRDITPRKDRERRREDFISITNHELKMPITTLKGLTQLLLRQLERQGMQEPVSTLTKMDAQINRLVKLIDELLDVSKIQAERLDYEEKPVDVDAFVHETVELLQSTIPSHVLNVSGATLAVVVGDRDRLGQALTNLITNAVKYSPKATSVDILLAGSHKSVTIAVRDYGVGIPKASQKRIFDRYYRVYGEQDKAFPGLGVGLYIASEIVKRHGGDITVESEEGQGSTFLVSLPLK